MSSRSRLRFSTKDDLELLRAAGIRNPWENPANWTTILETVQDTTGKPFTVRGIKDHLEHLLKVFSVGGIKKSGSEAEFSEKMQHLHHLNDLKQGFVTTSNTTLEEKDSELASRKRKVIELDDNTCSKNVIYISSEEWPLEEVECDSPVLVKEAALHTSSKTSHSEHRNSTIEYLSPKEKADYELQQRQLRLEERKLEIEQQRLDFDKEKYSFEKEELKTLLELQGRERESYMKILQKQQEMILLMLSQIVKKN